MRYMEFGKENKDTILLLHGGGLSWWNYREAAQNLSSEYRVILPILDGHAGSDADFTSMEESAASMIHFIDTHLGGSVLILGGLSLGGQVLLEMLSQRRNLCRYALVESASVVPSKVTHALIPPTFGSCYGLIRQRWFAKLQFQYLRIQPPLFEDYYRDTCGISKANMIGFLRANALYAPKPALSECSAGVFLFVGQKETGQMRKSAEILHGILPGSSLTVLPQLHHGEFSINHGGAYAETIREILRRR